MKTYLYIAKDRSWSSINELKQDLQLDTIHLINNAETIWIAYPIHNPAIQKQIRICKVLLSED